MTDMAEVLKGPTLGPTGDRFPTGHAVPAHWPDWFVADLRNSGHIVEQAAKRAPRKAAARRPRKAAK